MLLSGCGKSKEDQPAGAFSNSVFIVNEGPFQTGSGSISAFDRDSLKVTNDIFEKVNGWPLGNIVQSLTVFNDKAFIVVNNSNKIEVVNLGDFKSVKTIDNLPLPRCFIGYNASKGYVSCWDSTVKVISMIDYSVISSIPAGTGPDEMILSGNELFVINCGGFAVDSIVTVINTVTDEFSENILVGHRPSGIQADRDGNLWVLCSGKGWNGFPAPGDSPAKLICLDPDSHHILKEFTFPDSENHPDNLVIDEKGTTLYYCHPEGIFAFSIYSQSLEAQPFIIGGSMYYGLGYDKSLKMIYATDPLDYAQNGWVYRFNAADGSAVDSLMVGVVPNNFWFN
jgi:DNA-binding beta-propeller fold protein YncE